MAEDVVCGSDSVKKMLNYVDNSGNVYILGDFDESISENVVPNLVKRIKEIEDTEDAKIFFYINSHGGVVSELYNLLALIDLAKMRGIKIYTIITGNAFSCGSMLAIHGDHRAIYKYGKHLMHLGEQGNSVQTFTQMERCNKEAKEHFENIVQMYVEHTNMTEKQVRDILKDDCYYMNAQECKELGLVDEIIGEEVEPPEVWVKDGTNLDMNGLVVKIRVGDPKNNKDKRVTHSKSKAKEK